MCAFRPHCQCRPFPVLLRASGSALPGEGPPLMGGRIALSSRWLTGKIVDDSGEWPFPRLMEHKGWHSRGYLPHLDAPGELQALTFRLHDSVPTAVVAKWRRELEGEPEPIRQRELRKRIARFEDAGHGACLLSVPAHAEVVESCLLRSDGVRYRLIEWCIMPNHVHVLIGTMQGMRLGDIVRSWKTYSAKTMNGSLGKFGAIWEEDYHDRYIRDMDHLHDAKAYIRRNPVSAGLCAQPEDWPWSSAAKR